MKYALSLWPLGNVKIVKNILMNGAVVNRMDDDGNTAFHIATLKGD